MSSGLSVGKFPCNVDARLHLMIRVQVRNPLRTVAREESGVTFHPFDAPQSPQGVIQSVDSKNSPEFKRLGIWSCFSKPL